MAEDLVLNKQAQEVCMPSRGFYINPSAVYTDAAGQTFNTSSYFHVFTINLTTATILLPSLVGSRTQKYEGYIINAATATMQFVPATGDFINALAVSTAYTVAANATKNRFLHIIGNPYTQKWYISAVPEV